MKKADVVIDPDFQKLMPALTKEEHAELKKSIQAEGCRDAIVLWKERNILIDGHNRFEICKQLGTKVKFKKLSFENKGAAMDWVFRNQLGRRNLTTAAFNDFLGRLYNATKNPSGRPTKETDKTAGDTASAIGKQYGKSAVTVRRQGKKVIEKDKGIIKPKKNKVIDPDIICVQLQVDKQLYQYLESLRMRFGSIGIPASVTTVISRILMDHWESSVHKK